MKKQDDKLVYNTGKHGLRRLTQQGVKKIEEKGKEEKTSETRGKDRLPHTALCLCGC